MEVMVISIAVSIIIFLLGIFIGASIVKIISILLKRSKNIRMKLKEYKVYFKAWFYPYSWALPLRIDIEIYPNELFDFTIEILCFSFSITWMLKEDVNFFENIKNTRED